MTNEREDNGTGTMTLPRSRDRASQIDFLRELSLARRVSSPPTGPEPEADTSPAVVTPADVTRAADVSPEMSDEARWTMAFVPADSASDVLPQSPDVGSVTDDSAVAAWSSFPTEAALRPSSWFDDTETASASEPGVPSIGLFDIRPVSTWAGLADSDVTERPGGDIDRGVEFRGTGEVGSGDDGNDAAGDLFDRLPATTWPGVVRDEPALSGPSADVEELLAVEEWAFDRSESIEDLGPVGTTTTVRAIAEAALPVQAAASSAPAPVAVTVAERGDASAAAAAPGIRPPTITADTPVVARCSGVVASRIVRGRRHTVLSGVDLTVRSGEVAVITGRSGSGKTTLLECLAGLHRVDAGTIAIGETVLGEATEEQIADLRATTIGYVAQEPQLLADLSVIENIELPLLLSGWDPIEARTEADAAVSLVGLQHPTFRASELSTGERRRVAIARALVGEPSILWLDDASAAIDPETMAEIYELIFELCHDGLTVVAVTHDPAMLACATSTYELRDGSLHPVGA